jgi:hypothetical protein
MKACKQIPYSLVFALPLFGCHEQSSNQPPLQTSSPSPEQLQGKWERSKQWALKIADLPDSRVLHWDVHSDEPLLEGDQIFPRTDGIQSPADSIYRFSILLKDGTAVVTLDDHTYTGTYAIRLAEPSASRSFDVISDPIPDIGYPYAMELSLKDDEGKEYRHKWQVGLDKNGLMVVRFKYNVSGQIDGEKEPRQIVMSDLVVLQRASTNE